MANPEFNFLVGGDPDKREWACFELLIRIPDLRTKAFLGSIDSFRQLNEYFYFRLLRRTYADNAALAGIGILAAYEENFNGRIKFAIEAAWFENHVAAKEGLLNLMTWIKKGEFYDLFIHPETFFPQHSISKLLDLGQLEEYAVRREKHNFIQARNEGLWSAYTGLTQQGGVFVDCVQLISPRVISFSGVAYKGNDPLFRGEGRFSVWPYENCKTIENLVEEIFNVGFFTRGKGNFSGALSEQILHQGYVPSSTVSLTKSKRVAANYATASGKRELGVVFSISSKALQRHGPVWDSVGSMRAANSLLSKEDESLITQLVEGCKNLKEAGDILEEMYNALRSKAQTFRNNNLLQLGPDHFIKPDIWKRASELLTESQLHYLCSILEPGLCIRILKSGIYGFNF